MIPNSAGNYGRVYGDELLVSGSFAINRSADFPFKIILLQTLIKSVNSVFWEKFQYDYFIVPS